MSLVLRLTCASVLIAMAAGTAPHTAVSGPANNQKQADVCELLKESPTDNYVKEYPNEFYDCTAHHRFFKMGYEVAALANRAS